LHGESIYRFASGQTVIPYAYPFRYLPVVAYTVGPLLTLAPPTLSYSLWLAFCELCLIRNIGLTNQLAGGGLRAAKLGFVWLAFTPFFLELWMGQFTFLLGSLLFWSILAYESGREGAARRWWIVSVLWKPASLLWLPIWLREKHHWKAVAFCFLALLANGAYFLVFRSDWPLFKETNLDSTPTWHAGNLGLSALIYSFTGKGPVYAITRMAVTGLLLAPAVWCTFRARRTPVWQLGALWTCAYFLIYKDVWEHHLTLLLPFLVLSILRAPSRITTWVVVLLALPSPFVFYDVPGIGFNIDPQPLFSPEVSLLHHSWRVLPLLALYLHWVASIVRAERKAPAIDNNEPSPPPRLLLQES
jgi:hypothetical protein